MACGRSAGFLDVPFLSFGSNLFFYIRRILQIDIVNFTQNYTYQEQLWDFCTTR